MKSYINVKSINGQFVVSQVEYKPQETEFGVFSTHKEIAEAMKKAGIKTSSFDAESKLLLKAQLEAERAERKAKSEARKIAQTDKKLAELAKLKARIAKLEAQV